eukprot:gene14572-19565_t
MISNFAKYASPALVFVTCSTNLKKSHVSFATSKAATKKVESVSLRNKVVLITGASAGIGTAIAWRFADEGSKLILVARREDKLISLKNEILAQYPQLDILTVPVSVSDIDKVALIPAQLPPPFQQVDILVNNAGLALGVNSVENNSVEDAKVVLDTNVLGVVAMCSAFVPQMKTRGSGHIINIGSVAGHHAYATGSVYNASKYAIHGFTSAARHDLMGTPVRVTHISPGLVKNTEFSNVRLKDDAKAVAVYDNIMALDPDDVADFVVYAASRPAHVQIADIIVYCTNQAGPRDIVRAGPLMGGPSV